jgi:Ca2+-binding RTX toxin-like protein
MALLEVLIETGLAFDPTGLNELDSPDFELLEASGSRVAILHYNGYIEVLEGSGLLGDDGIIQAIALTADLDAQPVFAISGVNLPVDVTGGDADLVLLSLQGSDTLLGSQGPDRLYGQSGDDLVRGGNGGDVLYGNAGSDLIYGNQAADYLFGGQAADTLFGGQDSDLIYGNADADQVYGNFADDFLFGGQGEDSLFGGQGNDLLFGNRDNDLLAGNLGDDVLEGGAGDDTLSGGAGADWFICGGGPGNDLITDFAAADDYIGLVAEPLAITQTEGGTLIQFDTGNVVVLGVEPEALDGRIALL